MTGQFDDREGSCLGENDRYVVQQKLGEGGMGSVWRAHDRKRDRTVAVKFLSSSGASDRESLHRFKREGTRFGKLAHPNVIRVFAVGRQGGSLFMVTEFVAGLNLYEALSRDGVFPVERALEIIQLAADGLHHAHESGVIHRDLKPENIMIRDEDGAVKVIDFGIAKSLDESFVLTKQGVYIGTPAYSSPEQIRGQELTRASDTFSLGVILYELLAGKVAFDGRHTTDVLKATIKRDPVPVEKLNEGVIRPVAQLIQRMIEKAPKKRPASMDEVAEEIGGILHKLQSGWDETQDVDRQTWMRRMLRRWFQGEE